MTIYIIISSIINNIIIYIKYNEFSTSNLKRVYNKIQ